MTNPQQPELHRSGYGDATQDAKEIRADSTEPSTSGSAGPTPDANATQDARRSGSASTTRDALER